VTIGRDQLRALAVLRYWFGDLEVLVVLEREGSGEGATLPRLASQLALATERPGSARRPTVKAGRQAIPQGREAALTGSGLDSAASTCGKRGRHGW
jgi:hypothetical protein